MDTYKIVRYCLNDSHPDHHTVIEEGLTWEDAQKHCNDPATQGEDSERGLWFDGYQKEVK